MNAGTIWNKNEESAQVKQTIQLEEITYKLQVKARKLKIYRERIQQNRKKGHSKSTRNISPSKSDVSAATHTNKWMSMKQ